MSKQDVLHLHCKEVTIKDIHTLGRRSNSSPKWCQEACKKWAVVRWRQVEVLLARHWGTADSGLTTSAEISTPWVWYQDIGYIFTIQIDVYTIKPHRNSLIWMMMHFEACQTHLLFTLVKEKPCRNNFHSEIASKFHNYLLKIFVYRLRWIKSEIFEGERLK